MTTIDYNIKETLSKMYDLPAREWEVKDNDLMSEEMAILNTPIVVRVYDNFIGYRKK